VHGIVANTQPSPSCLAVLSVKCQLEGWIGCRLTEYDELRLSSLTFDIKQLALIQKNAQHSPVLVAARSVGV